MLYQFNISAILTRAKNFVVEFWKKSTDNMDNPDKNHSLKRGKITNLLKN